jgi:hypothetical protein
MFHNFIINNKTWLKVTRIANLPVLEHNFTLKSPILTISLDDNKQINYVQRYETKMLLTWVLWRAKMSN